MVEEIDVGLVPLTIAICYVLLNSCLVTSCQLTRKVYILVKTVHVLVKVV